MIDVNNLKTGVTIEYENNIYQVIDFQHVKPGKGAAFVRTKLKNIRTGATLEHTFNSGIKLTLAHVSKKTMQFLYASGDSFSFMNMETYEQLDLDKSIINDQALLLKEGSEVTISYFNDELLGIDLPEKITLKVTSTEPAVKGNTTSSAMKDATLETGLIIKVPLFIEIDDDIIISSRDMKYVSRG